MTDRPERIARAACALDRRSSQKASLAQPLRPDDLAELERALAMLPRLTRDVFLASRRDGYDHDDIAKMMGIGRRRVERHLTKALVYLDRIIAGDRRTAFERWWQAFTRRWRRTGDT